MNYTSAHPRPILGRRAALLRSLGAVVRKRRNDVGLSMKALGAKAGVSERFLAQLEAGLGNISVVRLQDIAEALSTTASALLDAHPEGDRPAGAPCKVVALLGLRGAGKSTLGPEVARRLGVAFFELDALVALEAGMPVGTIFEIHGEAWFRKLELQVLRSFLATHQAGVLATGGALVTSPAAYDLVRQRTISVWLKARAQDHWDRVLRQGDARPMRNRESAMSELKALLRTRKPLYSLADHVVDTSSTSFEQASARVVAAVTPASSASANLKRSPKR